MHIDCRMDGIPSIVIYSWMEFRTGFIDKSDEVDSPGFNFFLIGKATKVFDNPCDTLNNLVDVF